MGLFALITIIVLFLVGSISIIFSIVIEEKDASNYEYSNSKISRSVSSIETNPKNNLETLLELEPDFLYDDELEL